MLITKLFPSGAYEVTDIIGNQLIRRVYYGYTRAECARLFRAEVRTLNGGKS